MIYTKEQTTSFHEQTFAYLIIEEKNNVLSITLNRPDKRNAFHQPLANELAYALAYAHYTNSVWAVVLKANGPVFCAGADLKAFAGISEEGPQSSIPMPSGMIALGDEFKGLHKPCIAQVHGDVYAGGFLMICGCTHVVAVEEAKFGLPEVKRGIWPMQVMASLMPLMSARDMLDLCMRAKTIDAAEAKRLGIVSDVVKAGELENFVQGLVNDIKEQSPTAIRFGLEAFEKMQNLSEGEKHKYLQGMLMKVLSSKDAQEGLAAFREKRKAEWIGE
jgi:enoyl-CoA hydratase/carnithine racemase